jgi:hypothetical protein
MIASAIAPQAPPVLELPPSRAADVTARIPADAAPAKLPEIAEDAWAKPATWKRFGDLLAAEAAAKEPDPARRAELALLALAGHRYGDAWERYEECAGSPPTLAALLPHFLPGIPVSRGADRALEDGAVLAPALPPFLGDVALPPRGYLQRRAMRIGNVAVGAARIALRISVEGEGVEIDVEHVSGPAVKIAVRIPEDPEYGFSDEYVDWYRQEERSVPHAVALAPGDEPHTVYARFEPRRAEWPTKEPDLVPAQLENGTVRLLAGSSPEDRALADAVAAFLSASPLRIAARRMDSRGATAEPFGVEIDLSRPADRARKLAWIAGAVEKRVLGEKRVSGLGAEKRPR